MYRHLTGGGDDETGLCFGFGCRSFEVRAKRVEVVLSLDLVFGHGVCRW